MRFLLIIPVKFYQVFFPKKYRGKCLYKVSCSNHVLRQTKTLGFVKGIEALKHRIKNCRPMYKIIELDEQKILITTNHEVIEEKDMDRRLLDPVAIDYMN